MKIFGFEIRRIKASVPMMNSANTGALYSPAGAGSGGWYPIVRESYAGAWQQNQELACANVLAYAAVYACVTLISSDISKMRLRLVFQDIDGIWNEMESPAFSPLLRKPNRYQTRIDFFGWWVMSKLTHGNTYALKQRDERNIVTALYILDPCRTKPLVAPDGSVFYSLSPDNLSGLDQAIIVPASEIIHDKYDPLFHPLIGVSPLFACSLAALLGLKIQNQSASFFANGSQPGGVLTAPGAISQETADRAKLKWETEFSGQNAGKVAVLGDGLKYEPMSAKATDSQLIEQLKWSGEDVCRAFKVPAYMIGVTQPPNFNNIEALNQQYYSQCLQTLIEELEIALDEGLGLAPDKVNGIRMGVEFDLDDLLRMDTASLIKSEKDATGLKKVNESRKRLNLPPVDGGDTVYLQQQYFSLEALNKRDQQADPFGTPQTSEPAAPAAPSETEERMITDWRLKAYALGLVA